MNILIIGSDSFIARKFIKKYENLFFIKPISRVCKDLKNEIVQPSFFNIQNSCFHDIDIVINFAAIVHRPDINNENLYDEINYKLSIVNAQKAKDAGVKLFIQMSTIAVYGDCAHININTPYQPTTPYGRSKLKADNDLIQLQDEFFKVAIVRPPMVYGGGKAPGNMIRLIQLAQKNIPLPFKKVDNRRDFINVNNLVQYLSIIVEKRLAGIFLITDNEPVSTEYLLFSITKHLGKPLLLFKIPEIGLKLLRKFKPNEYSKLFGTLSIQTNFPFENLIDRYTVNQGIGEMINPHD